MRDLTPEEKQVLDDLVSAWNKFSRLPVLHALDQPEFLRHIHGAQNIILARPSIRQRGLSPNEVKR